MSQPRPPPIPVFGAIAPADALELLNGGGDVVFSATAKADAPSPRMVFGSVTVGRGTDDDDASGGSSAGEAAHSARPPPEKPTLTTRWIKPPPVRPSSPLSPDSPPFVPSQISLAAIAHPGTLAALPGGRPPSFVPANAALFRGRPVAGPRIPIGPPRQQVPIPGKFQQLPIAGKAQQVPVPTPVKLSEKRPVEKVTETPVVEKGNSEKPVLGKAISEKTISESTPSEPASSPVSEVPVAKSPTSESASSPVLSISSPPPEPPRAVTPTLKPGASPTPEPTVPSAPESPKIEDLRVSSPPPPAPVPAPAPAPPTKKSWADLVRPAGPPKGAPRPPSSNQKAALQPSTTFLSSLLSSFDHTVSSPSLRPRGLINEGNTCYMNSALHPLLQTPLVPLLKILPLPMRGKPLLNAMSDFIGQFDGKSKDPFSPVALYDALRARGGGKKGRQEDAEEWLGFLLSGLHEELLGFMPEQSGGETEQWNEVGSGKRTVEARYLLQGETPVSKVFWGRWRGVVKKGSRESVTVEPFLCLPLDIAREGVETIEDALRGFGDQEVLDGGRGVKRVMLERLPGVLVVQLKRFVYEGGGVRKLAKRVGLGAEVRLEDAILSPPLRTDPLPTYRLVGVVYHLGSAAGGGHYTCAVRTDKGWVAIDDTTVEELGGELGERPGEAYLLFYCRVVG